MKQRLDVSSESIKCSMLIYDPQSKMLNSDLETSYRILGKLSEQSPNMQQSISHIVRDAHKLLENDMP